MCDAEAGRVLATLLSRAACVRATRDCGELVMLLSGLRGALLSAALIPATGVCASSGCVSVSATAGLATASSAASRTGSSITLSSTGGSAGAAAVAPKSSLMAASGAIGCGRAWDQDAAVPART